MTEPHLKRRLHLIANLRSGKGEGGENLFSLAQRLCQEYGASLVQYEIKKSEQLVSKIEDAIKAAAGHEDVIVVAGGDGTIRIVAERIAPFKIKLAVIPCGTFNFFARTHKIPADHEQAVLLAITGEATSVRLGDINGRTFLVNASLGIYAKSIQEREKNSARFGRSQIVAIISTCVSLLKPHRLLDVKFKVNENQKILKASMVFIGNNALQLRNLSLSVAECLNEDHLAIVTLKPVRVWEMLLVILRGLTKMLNSENRITQFSTDCLSIETKRVRQSVALDGELLSMESPFEVKSLPGALQLILPDKCSSLGPHSIAAS